MMNGALKYWIFAFMLLFSVGVFSQSKILVDIQKQELILIEKGKAVEKYKVSTAKNGVGSLKGSGKTPLGKHKIYKKIGENHQIGSVFVGRQFTGKVYEIGKEQSERDLVLTRILQLQGLEPGINRGGDVDSLERCIYIHGTNDEELIGKPVSHGCVRMRNEDVINLYEKVDVNTIVEIVYN